MRAAARMAEPMPNQTAIPYPWPFGYRPESLGLSSMEVGDVKMELERDPYTVTVG